MSIYQFDLDLNLIATYDTLMDASDATGIPFGTLSSSTLRRAVCRNKYYFGRSSTIIPASRARSFKPGSKFTVLVTNEIWDEMLVLIGQRKKQDIFRDLLKEWIEKEKQKNK
jgi:hypothetical protein